MGERYFVTGVQLGMLLAYSKESGMFNEAYDIVDEVTNNQFIGNTNSPLTNPTLDVVTRIDGDTTPDLIKKKIDEDYINVEEMKFYKKGKEIDANVVGDAPK